MAHQRQFGRLWRGSEADVRVIASGRKIRDFLCVGLRRVAEFFRPGPGGLRRTRVGINRCSRHRRLRLAARPDWRGLFEARFGEKLGAERFDVLG